MAETPSTLAPYKRRKFVGDKRHAKPKAQPEEVKFFPSDKAYERYCATMLKIVAPLKCWVFQFLQSRPLRNLYEILDH